MAIKATCPKCFRTYSVKDDIGGKAFRCKDCQSIVNVPAGSGSPVSKSPKSAQSADAADEWGYDDWTTDDQDAAALPAPKKRTAKSVRSGTFASGLNSESSPPKMPIEAMLAIGCIAVLGVLNLWELGSGDALVWKLIAVVRIAVEARVVWGIYKRINQTGIAATIAAVMMTVLSVFLLWTLATDPDLRIDMPPQEFKMARIFFSIQTAAEIGIIIGLNLPRSRSYLSPPLTESRVISSVESSE